MDLLQRIVDLAAFADANGYGVLSTGEQLAVALVLDRPDWLAELDYSMAEAIGRVGDDWIAVIPAAAREFARQRDEKAYAAAARARTDKLEDAKSAARRDDTVHFATELVTYGEAPGYRDATLVFNLRPLGHDQASFRADLRIRPQDAETIVRHLRDVHQLAWSRGEPLDIKPGETRPAWIDRC